jgi:signal transduction histidine kinase
MKPVYIFLLLLAPTQSFGQTVMADSLKRLLLQKHSDTSRILLQVQLAQTYLFYQQDSAIILAHQAIQQARRLHFAKGESRALNALGNALRLRGELPQSLERQFQALQISRTIGDQEGESRSLDYIGVIYHQVSEYRQALRYYQQALKISKRFKGRDILTLSSIGDAYENMDQLDSALLFHRQAYALLKGLPRGTLHSLISTRFGMLQVRLGNNSGALRLYQNAIRKAVLIGDMLNQGRAQFQIAELYYQLHQPDSSSRYAHLAFVTSQRVSHKLTELSASTLLVKLYRANGNLDSAFHYQQVAMAAKDSLYGPERFKQLQLLTLSEHQRQQQLRQDQARSQDRFQRISLLSALGVFLLIALLLWRNNRQQQRANRALNQKNVQIETQREALQTTLAELETTQAQLIEKEKITSLYQQQLKIQQVRNKIAAELHDDIGSTLSSIYLFSEVAKKEINQDSLQALPMLEKIESSSHEMMQSMSEIVWAIQPKNDDTANLVEKIHSFANELLSARNIRFRFEYPDQFLSIPIAMEVRRNIYLIFKEALNNIAKHSGASEAGMEVALEEKNLCIDIRDNGQGFNTQTLSKGNGVRNLYSRAEEIGGRLRIDSQPGRGTGVYLQCPLP